MVIKILRASHSFDGVDYNDKKTLKNKARLLALENFPFQDMDASDVRNYLQAVSELNPRVKRKQFHATVSSKGTKHTFEELSEIGRALMEYMGYGSNPYVIYAHTDTPNRHVHIVSSRVNLKGEKISDSFEKIRVQNFIKNHLKIDYASDLQTRISETKEYSIATRAQFGMLLERYGYMTRQKNGMLEIIKSGTVQDKIALTEIDRLIASRKLAPEIKKKNKAYLYKYAKGSTRENLSSDMRRMFGWEIIYHYPKKQKDTTYTPRERPEPYGYSVIDHHNKTVFKGSELVSLSKLKMLFAQPIDKEQLASLIHDLRKIKNVGYRQILDALKPYGLTVDRSGNVLYAKNKKVLGQIDEGFLFAAKYNQRLRDVNKAIYSRNVSPTTLSRAFRVEPSEIQFMGTQVDSSLRSAYRQQILESMALNPFDPALSEHLRLWQQGNQTILIDYSAGVFLSVENDLDIQMPLSYKNSVKKQTDYSSDQHFPYPGMGLNQIASLIPWLDESADDDALRRKRKRRQQRKL